jgi:rod shape-determining protein MreB
LVEKIKTSFEDATQKFGMDLGVDMGSSNMRIYLKSKGVVVEEPSLVARLKRKRWMGLNTPQIKPLTTIAFGDKAKEMKSKEPVRMEVVAPIEYGIVNDLELVEKLVSNFLKYIYDIPSKYPKLLKPRVIVSVPCSVSDVQKRAVKSVFKAIGVREVVLIEDMVVAAIGAGLPLDSSGGLMVVDVGGGKTEVAVISLGGVVVVKGSKISSQDFDDALVNYIKMKYGMLIGPNTAEKVKIEMGSVWGEENKKSMVIRGRNLETGLPMSIKLNQSEVRESLVLVGSRVVKLVKETLDETPPELVEDIIKKGIVMVGGGSKIDGLDKLIEFGTKVTTRVAANGEDCIINGLSKLVEDRSLLGKFKQVAGL